MYVCLCTGATVQRVRDVIAAGATTSRQVAEECGAGSECGRCRRTVRAILADEVPTPPGRRVWPAAD
jgi:bacterioferritin-associated ferredoxin